MSSRHGLQLGGSKDVSNSSTDPWLPLVVIYTQWINDAGTAKHNTLISNFLSPPFLFRQWFYVDWLRTHHHTSHVVTSHATSQCHITDMAGVWYECHGRIVSHTYIVRCAMGRHFSLGLRFNLLFYFWLAFVWSSSLGDSSYSNWYSSIINADLASSVTMTAFSTVLSCCMLSLNSPLVLHVVNEYTTLRNLELFKGCTPITRLAVTVCSVGCCYLSVDYLLAW